MLFMRSLSWLLFIFFLFITPFSKAEKLPFRKIISNLNANVSLLTYNVWGLPIALPGHDQNFRFISLADSLLKKNSDILCLQEIFSSKFRKLNLDKLSREYRFYTDYTCSQTILPGFKKDCHGGLATFSKFPILEEKFYAFPEFDDMRWEEKIGAKGFLVSKIQFPYKTSYVVNTHLYSGGLEMDEAIREKQMHFMHKVIDSLNAQLPIILMGDFNIAHPELCNDNFAFSTKVYNYITHEMGFDDSIENYAENKQYYTIDPKSNHYCDSSEGRQKLDYIFFRKGNKKIEILKTYIEMNNGCTLSDHFAFAAEINLK